MKDALNTQGEKTCHDEFLIFSRKRPSVMFT